ncbi:hypothetical protein ABWJ92_10510 [Streptomyces sp. NPDC000609]|uniref:hypothetical protein n=1 Tax=Streptomyces sp. NPDC000609 TaxID=3160957 RepID=UPI003395F1AF
MRTVAITGTRSTDHRPQDEYVALFATYLGVFARSAFYIGGAKGIDSWALLWLAESTSADITVVVPGTVAQQPEEAQQAVYRAHNGNRIKEIVELGAPVLSSEAYHARNRWMVDRSALTIGFPHATKPSSGTWQTINYTADQGKPRLIVPV